MVHAPIQRPRMTEAEYLALPETTARMELIDGEVIVSPSPLTRHQVLVLRLGAGLEMWSRTQPVRPIVMVAPSDVRFAPRCILQPDLYVLDGTRALPQRGPVRQIPILCVEVLSRDKDYDRVTKRSIYADAGVREMWTVDAAGVVETWRGRGLDDHGPVEGGVLRSELLPGFELLLGELFG